MFRKIVLTAITASSFLFSMSANMVQNAPKEKLGCIKGIGIKRVQAIMVYRKQDTIDGLEELLNIKGIGTGILKNIKNDIKKKSCKISDNNRTTHKEKKKRANKKNISAE